MERIDFKKGSFRGKSGKEYLIAESLSEIRFEQFDSLMNTFGFGKDFEAVAKDIQNAIAFFDKGQASKSIIILTNLIEGIVRHLENRIPPAIEICALFCNSEDEDQGIYDPVLMRKKVDDWGAVDSRDFFTLACNLVPGFIQLYEEVSQSILKTTTELEKMTEQLKPSDKLQEKIK